MTTKTKQERIAEIEEIAKSCDPSRHDARKALEIIKEQEAEISVLRISKAQLDSLFNQNQALQGALESTLQTSMASIPKSLSVIERLQIEKQRAESDERYARKLHENSMKVHNATAAAQNEEIREYIQALKFINGSFETATRQAQEAHKVLKKFGKL